MEKPVITEEEQIQDTEVASTNLSDLLVGGLAMKLRRFKYMSTEMSHHLLKPTILK